jgi:hypothetical protein
MEDSGRPDDGRLWRRFSCLASPRPVGSPAFLSRRPDGSRCPWGASVARRTALLVIGVLAVGGAAAAGYVVSHPGATEQAAAAADPWQPTGTAAVSPPPADPADVATDTAKPASAALQITYSGTDPAGDGVAVGAYVAGLIEDGGTCAMTLTLDGHTASVQTDGLADASTTSCGRLVVPFSKLSPGTWTAEVTYSSPSGKTVTPAQTTVEVAR